MATSWLLLLGFVILMQADQLIVSHDMSTTGGVRIPLEELLQQLNRELLFPLYDRTKQEAGTIQVSP